MSKAEDLAKTISDMAPEGVVMKHRNESICLACGDKLSKSEEITFCPGESILSRENALKLFEEIRSRFPDLEESSFREYRDHEWEIEMSFKIPVDVEKTSEDNE